jgi:short-subunit dehydrogenase
MKALVTGASSGIGRDMAIVLSKMGYDLILVARRKEKLQELSMELPTKSRIICMDISEEEACLSLFDMVKEENIEILINNAGFGIFGAFVKTDLKTELRMIDTNIKAVHILTKLFLEEFISRNSGYILNVASSAAFLPGPLLSGYYATKAYVLRLTQAIHEELRREGSRVYIGTLCPGPVETEFDKTANVKFSVKGLSSSCVAEYAIKMMFIRRMTIVPGTTMKLARFFDKITPDKLLLRIAYKIQKRKEGGN